MTDVDEPNRGMSSRLPSRDKSGRVFATDDGEKVVHPDLAIDAIEDVDEGDPSRLSDKLPTPVLPGFGERRDSCGDDFPRFCAGCGKTHFVGQTCSRSACPRCWKAWARDRATSVASKLEALRRYRESSGPGWQGWKFHHLAISPPEGYAVDADDPLEATVEVLKNLLDELGVGTFAWFYHPYRGEDGDDRGFWKDLLPDGEEESWPATREQLSAQPHFHVVALAKHVPGGDVTKAIEDRTGWVIHRITQGEDSNVSIYDQYDLARVASYCISHSGVDMTGERNRAMYGYSGEVHNFTATDRVAAQMDAAVRSVAPKTLGLEYDDLACGRTMQAARRSSSSTRVDIGSAHSSSSSSSSSTSTSDDAETSTAEKVRCEGRLLDINKAPAFLDDKEWMAAAAYADELQTTWDDWSDEVHTDPVELEDVYVDPADVDADDLDPPD